MLRNLLTSAVVFAGLLLTLPVGGAELRTRPEIAYVDATDASPLQRLDAYWTPERTGQPVMIYIHGGGWRKGDKANVARKPQAFADQGFAFVSVNYRLHPQTDFRGQGADVARAIQHVVANASQAGVDPERVYLMGHSAGAHLAALVATDDSYLKAVGLPLTTIKGVVLLDGAGYDIPRQIATVQRETSELLYETVFGKDLASQQAASPITHVAAGKWIPPFLILPIAIRADSGVQSDALAEKLRAAGGEAQVVRCPGQTHGSINQQFGTPDHLATTETFRFLQAREAALSQARAASPGSDAKASPQ